MSATPYELRAQLLRQAEGILIHRYQIEHDKVRENVHLNRERDPTFDVNTVTYPKYPTTEDIINEAEKLYRFVQTK
tara:strand:+ start:456 stop:683 length:228 start_codon:yes stop_codon:yes gene_type:complete